MFLYLIVLAVIALGATTLIFVFLQTALGERKVTIYDARGFYMIALVFVTFLLTSLAYYWGISRFDIDDGVVSKPILGVLFALCSSLSGLGIGLIRLKEEETF